MTIKTKVGKSFGGITRYATQECKEARVLGAVGVRTDSAAHMADDFEFRQRRRPGLGNAVLHVAISLSPEESRGQTREQTGTVLRQAADAWRQEMKIADTQWVLIQHFDRDHAHAHLILNRVDNAGQPVPDSFIGQRSRQAAQVVERQLGLPGAEQRGREHAAQPGLTPSQQRARTPHEVRHADRQRTRHEVANALLTAKGQAGSFEALQNGVVWHGIVVRPVEHPQADGSVAHGVVFSKNGFDFKGSEVGREFGAGHIQRAFAAYQTQAAEQNDASRQLAAAFAVGKLGQLFADGAQLAQEKQSAAAPRQSTGQVVPTPALPENDVEFSF